MISSYTQKFSTIQKVACSKASSLLDSSSQSESLQRKADMVNAATQRAEAPRPNNTGMPDNLKAGIESLSGYSMDDVRVHYNSSKPATVQALAYTQGTDIHVAPGQEKCLPHEAWHVAQQMAGRVSPTTNINGMPVNDNAALEHEADVMGEKAVQCKNTFEKNTNCSRIGSGVTQCLAIQYGNVPPVPKDAEQIAKGQNVERNNEKKGDIGVLSFNDVESGPLRDGKKRNAEYIKTNMMNREKIYIVSHGLPAMGNQPARLVGENNDCKNGNAVANVIRILKTAFEEKVGDIKIEACCSSLRRNTHQNTNQSLFDRLLNRKQDSLVENVAKRLKGLKNVNVTGNSGYARGTKYGKNGVSTTRGGVTELGHLYNIFEILYNGVKENKLNRNKIQAYRTDAIYILKNKLEQIKKVLAVYLKIKKHGKMTADGVIDEMIEFFIFKIGEINKYDDYAGIFLGIVENCWTDMGLLDYGKSSFPKQIDDAKTKLKDLKSKM